MAKKARSNRELLKLLKGAKRPEFEVRLAKKQVDIQVSGFGSGKRELAASDNVLVFISDETSGQLEPHLSLTFNREQWEILKKKVDSNFTGLASFWEKPGMDRPN